MRILKLVAVAGALYCANGIAQAQIYVGEESRDFSGVDKGREADLERDRRTAEVRKPERRVRGSRALPASPDDVRTGSEIRDSKGVVIGTVVSLSMSAAVVESSGGKVEVPLESFGKNDKGLLLGMTKAEFDAAVASANSTP